MSDDEALECLEQATGECEGPVNYHSVDPGKEKAWPRCEYHWDKRLERYQNSIESEALSDVEPAWFDPSAAGERWDDDY